MNLVRPIVDLYFATNRDVRSDRVTRSLAKQLGLVDSLLDVGCGDGRYTRRLAEEAGASRACGVDVKVREHTYIEVQKYDGHSLPFPSQSFDAVTMVDVLHHCDDPQRVLDEALRVARKVVAVKDHFAFGPVTRQMLYAMDVVGNARFGIPSPGTYFSPTDWVRMVDAAGGRIASLEWPLKLHDLPWRILGWPELQFTARIVPVRP